MREKREKNTGSMTATNSFIPSYVSPSEYVKDVYILNAAF